LGASFRQQIIGFSEEEKIFPGAARTGQLGGYFHLEPNRQPERTFYGFAGG